MSITCSSHGIPLPKYSMRRNAEWRRNTKTKAQWSLILVSCTGFIKTKISAQTFVSAAEQHRAFFILLQGLSGKLIGKWFQEESWSVGYAVQSVQSHLLSADKEQEVLFEPFENSQSTRRWVLLETVQRRSSTEEDNHLQILPAEPLEHAVPVPEVHCFTAAGTQPETVTDPEKTVINSWSECFTGVGSSGPRGKTLISLNRLIKTLQHSYSNRSAKWRVCCAALTHQTSSAWALPDLSYLVAVLSNQAHTNL